MTNFQKSDLNLINTWLQSGADAYRTRMSCFRQLPCAQLPKLKPFKRLNASTRQYTGLKAGVNEIQGFIRKCDS
jgi:hypothetical protein